MGRKTKGPYLHAICGKKAQDAFDLRRQVTCKKCIAIRNGLAAQSCAPSQPGATSGEVASLRAELEEVKREVQQLKTRLGGEKIKGECTPPKPVEKVKPASGHEQALMRPEPKRIAMSGDGGSIRSGTYVKHDKNIYVLEVEANKMIKEAGFVSEDKLFRFGYLGFAFDNEAQAWLLVAKKDRMEKPYARERPDRSWQFWSDETKDWTDSHPSVCARY